MSEIRKSQKSIVRSPGDFIREELEKRGWAQGDLSRILDRPKSRVNEMIQGKVCLSPEMAFALGEVFSTGPEIWMQRETAYRLSLTTLDESIQKRAKLHEIAPIKDMEKRQWIKKTKTAGELEKELCRFFNVKSLEEERSLHAFARKTESQVPINQNQLAWCYRAKHLASAIKVDPFSKKKFEKGIKKLRALAAWPSETRRIPRILAGMGIRFVVVEPLPRTKIDGVAFFDNDIPVIALSLRYDRIDSLWQSLGHELSHIRHEDPVVIDEEIVGEQYRDLSGLSEIEQRADKEAAEMWIDPKELESFMVRVGPMYSHARINQFANLLKIHPGIIVGQLHHHNAVGYEKFRRMLAKIRDFVISEAITDGWGHVISV